MPSAEADREKGYGKREEDEPDFSHIFSPWEELIVC
jgi:hypothetical protein